MLAANDTVGLLVTIAIGLCAIVLVFWLVAVVVRWSLRVVTGERATLGSCLAALLVTAIVSLPVEFIASLVQKMARPEAGVPLLGVRLLIGLCLQAAIVSLMAKDARGRIATFWQACGASLLHSLAMIALVLVLAFGSYLAFPEQTLAAIQEARQRIAQVNAPATPEEAQREAVRKYPALAVPASRFNVEFLRRHAQYRREKPDYFRDPAWPLRLADEVAAAGF